MKNIIALIFIFSSWLCHGQGNGLYKFQAGNGKYGFMDKTGTIKIKAEYLNVGDFSEGLCYVSKEVIKNEYKWIFIDTSGEIAIDIKGGFPESNFSEGFAWISDNGEHWFVNKKGINEFGRSWVDAYGEFKNGIAFVSDKEYSDFYPINTKGERLSKESISSIEIYNSRKNSSLETKNKTAFKSDKFVAFEKDGLWGFKDDSNNVVIEPRFYLVDKFENGICAVRINKRDYEIANDYFLDAIIDEKGKVLNKIQMHCYRGFQGELIEFYGGPHFGGGVHYLDKKGKEVLPK